eukprot:gene2183-33798_t
MQSTINQQSIDNLSTIDRQSINKKSTIYVAGTVVTDFGAEDEVPATVTSGAQEVAIEEMSPFENYIYGMLTNYKELPLDRLHSMLRMFVVSPKALRYGIYGIEDRFAHMRVRV